MSAAVAAAVMGLPGFALAQSVLVVEHEGAPRVVRLVRNGVAYYEHDGQLRAARSSARGALAAARECAPFFVAVRSMRANQRVTVDTEDGEEFNHDFEFHAVFESWFGLKGVFLALELDLETGKYIFYHEVGDLAPRRERPLVVRVPLNEQIGEGRYKLHLFSEGRELLHSEQPMSFREHQLDRVIAHRIEGERNEPARPFVGPAPQYPPALLKARVTGQAVVKFRVSQRGEVIAPVVDTASRAEFGEAALAAARVWRFLPRIKDGKPVEAVVKLPFKFTPPPVES